MTGRSSIPSHYPDKIPPEMDWEDLWRLHGEPPEMARMRQQLLELTKQVLELTKEVKQENTYTKQLEDRIVQLEAAVGKNSCPAKSEDKVKEKKHSGPRCKDGSLDMRSTENKGKNKYVD